jgi:hypothetical protein
VIGMEGRLDERLGLQFGGRRGLQGLFVRLVVVVRSRTRVRGTGVVSLVIEVLVASQGLTSRGVMDGRESMMFQTGLCAVWVCKIETEIVCGLEMRFRAALRWMCLLRRRHG